MKELSSLKCWRNGQLNGNDQLIHGNSIMLFLGYISQYDPGGFSKYKGSRGARRKFSWQTLKDTCQFFVNHVLTPKRCQNLNP